jgi:hypothetical protein
MWLTPGHRTIWLRDRGVQDPLIFSAGQDDDRAELTITKIDENAVSGYLTLDRQN